jgi:hypothetical protein
MTQYLLSVHGTHDAPAPDLGAMTGIFAAVETFNEARACQTSVELRPFQPV